MSPRGGKREKAGRPSKGLQRTKVTVYTDTRDLLNQYAEEFDMPVVELYMSQSKILISKTCWLK